MSLSSGGLSPRWRQVQVHGAVARFADRTRFQNFDIQPDAKAEPTIAGIVSGRDEVLEKGIEVLMTTKGE
ncbi:MAG: hypothetical protein HY235_26450 [Acidobacteria bacterium]|nr:hypothetical protein [Acidobacteriota bacterium]